MRSGFQLPLFPPPPCVEAPPRPVALPRVEAPPRPAPSPRWSGAITADFSGAACPVGSRVRFRWRGQTIDGTVAELQRARAVVAAGDDALWKVPYRLLAVVERVPERECTLADVEKLAVDLLARHKAGSGLHADWGFGFDLSTSRAGVCRYDDRRIDLSVSYCLRGDPGRDRGHAAARDRPRHRRPPAPPRRRLEGRRAGHRLHRRALPRRRPHPGPLAGRMRLREAVAPPAAEPPAAARRKVPEVRRGDRLATEHPRSVSRDGLYLRVPRTWWAGA